MTAIAIEPTAMVKRSVRPPILLGVMLATGLGTSAEAALAKDPELPTLPLAQTSSGARVPAEAGGAGIAELRRLSGLTWEQLARLFKVNRRSLHFWASGKPMTPANEEHLQRLLVVLRKIDRGSASSNRAALLATTTSGVVIDLLRDGHYDRASVAIGQGGASTRPVRPMLSDEAKQARKPRPPNEIADAFQDRIHSETGRLIAARPIRRHREK